MNKIYDIVIFGASGFTGKYIAEELARVAIKKNTKWAVAGRNKDKLRKTLEESAAEIHIPELSSIPIIEADINDQNSLISMARLAKVIINAVGPYQNWGEQVIKACIEGDSSSIDISGEPIYLESIQLKYNEVARSKKIFLIGSCGFDSIPAEIGILYTMKQFPGQLNEIESYISSNNSSYCINTGTLESALIGMSNRHKLRTIRSQLYPTRLEKSNFIQYSQGYFFKSDVTNKWTLPFPGSDKSVVYRSQRFLFENNYIENPIQYAPYLCENSLLTTIRLAFCGLMILIFSTSDFGRKTFLKYPKVLSFGTFSKDGASRSELEKASFEMTFIGKGWKNGSSKSEPLNSKIKTVVRGPGQLTLFADIFLEAGYVACSICAVQAAFTILEEYNSMPQGGGALPPGAAFYNTNYINKLIDRGITFELGSIE